MRSKRIQEKKEPFAEFPGRKVANGLTKICIFSFSEIGEYTEIAPIA